MASSGGSIGTGGTAGSNADAGNVCPHVVGTADCPGSNPQCRPTWADVLANPVCTPATPLPAINYSYEVRFDCNGYHVSQVQHVDTSETYFYDAATGALVAFYNMRIAAVSCVAGPPSGVDTRCPNATATQVCPIDAGASILPPVDPTGGAIDGGVGGTGGLGAGGGIAGGGG